MTVSYRPAVAVKRLADELVPKHHKDLVDVRIEYVFRSETAKSKGREVWGTARKISGLNAYLSQKGGPSEAESGDVDYFVIEISEPVWQVLDAGQRRALVDHELCHCALEVSVNESTGEETVALKTRPHDVEEFRAVVIRHGLWREDLGDFAAALPEKQRNFEDLLSDSDWDGLEATVSIAGGAPIPIADAGPALAEHLLAQQLGGDAA